MKRLSTILCKILAMYFIANGQNLPVDFTPARSILTLHDESEGLHDALPINENTVFLFDKDSIRFKNKDNIISFSLSDFSSMNFTDCLFSDLSITTQTNNSSRLPIPEINVTLLSQETGFLSFNATSDVKGQLIIKDVPIGFYNIFCDDYNDIFYDYAMLDIMHTYKDNKIINLDEKMLTPIDFSYQIFKNQEDSFSAEISWRLANENDFTVLRNYKYDIWLDSLYHGQAQTNEYQIDGLNSGIHKISINPISNYDFSLQNPVDFYINISVSTSINQPDTDSLEAVRYYDLNGKQVDSRNLKSGLYIKQEGNNYTKIFIKNSNKL